MVPIPGTKRVKWLKQNIAALGLTLTEDELALLAPLGSQVSGARYQAGLVTAPGQYDVRADRRRMIRATGLGALCRPR
jgi:diketogulonate reductase-like aldo/keto reductase